MTVEDAAKVPEKRPKRAREKEAEDKAVAETNPEDREPGERKKKKKSKQKADVADDDVETTIRSDGMNRVGEGSTPLFAEESAPGSSDKNPTKKRRRYQDEAGAAEASTSKREKKRKNYLEVDETAAEEVREPSAEDVTAKPKKDKHRKRKDNSVEISVTQTATSISTRETSPSDGAAFLKKHGVTVHVPVGSDPVIPIVSFDQLEVPAELRAAFSGFKEPTPIQACSWPPALAGKDVVGIAETGSGKTLAFGLPALSRLISNPVKVGTKDKGTTVSVLVMAPTRELAIQTHETLEKLGEPFGIASVAVFGGVPKDPQVKALKNSNKDGKTTRIIVGTPGRIIDLVNDGACDLSRVAYLVLDEADRMLDRGFENDIRKIIGYTRQGRERQTLMFSATWPDAVRQLAASFQRDPVRVTVGSDELTANSRVEQVVEVFDDARSKDSRLLGHLRTLLPKNAKKGTPEDSRILVFALYKKEVSRVASMLGSKGFSVGELQGDMAQHKRTEALNAFKSGHTSLLVATDVAARGLDIPNVSAVINYTFPLTIEDYIHRIGRTGRGGKSGKSITFFTGDQHERALAGELARVLRESGFEAEGLKKFPMTIKKKEHSAYGAFYRDDIPTPSGPTKITFE